jgi:hypothetical protein
MVLLPAFDALSEFALNYRVKSFTLQHSRCKSPLEDLRRGLKLRQWLQIHHEGEVVRD